MEFALPLPNCGTAKFSTVGILGDVWVEIPGNAPYQLVWLPIVLPVPLGILPGANVRAVSHLSLAAIGSTWLLAWYELTPAERLEVGLPGECVPDAG